MKKNYFITVLLLPFLTLAQVTPITITSDLTADLTGYFDLSGNPVAEFPGQAEYFVYLSSDNILDKPIFLIDGFDPGDSRSIDELYASLDYTGNPNFTNLGDELRAEGFDLVLINFPTYNNGTTDVDGGADFIERNALTVVKIIETINSEKAANTPNQNVIIGPSMGGLIARYALNYMEAEPMLDADTQLYISIDAPHLGANVPIGLQHQFNYLAFNDLSPNAEVQPIINDVLNSPAARQLLIDHYLSHLEGSDAVTFDPNLTLPIPDNYRTQFLINLGDFPLNTRNIAVTNGSGIGASYLAKDGVTEVSPGFVIVDTTLQVDLGFPLGSIDVDIDISMTPFAGTPQQVSRFFTVVPFIGIQESIASSGTSNFDGIDAAPGGLFDLSSLAGDLPQDGIAADFLDALTIDKFSFIPTVSALALEITDEGNNADNVNWYHNIDLSSTRATTNNTPFDNTYLPDNNEDHVAITAANASFVLAEIRSTVLSNSKNSIAQIKIANNPVENEIVLITNLNAKAKVSVIDLTGKTVLNKFTRLSNNTVLPINLNSGFYILNIEVENGEIFSSKFIINK